MIEITNEKMEKLYKMQTTLVKSYTTISAIVIFVVLVITRLLRAVSSGDHAALSAVFMIILAADVVGYFIISWAVSSKKSFSSSVTRISGE